MMTNEYVDTDSAIMELKVGEGVKWKEEKNKLIKQLEDGIALEAHVTEALERLAKDVDEATRIRLNYILIFHSANTRYFEAVNDLLKGEL